MLFVLVACVAKKWSQDRDPGSASFITRKDGVMPTTRQLKPATNLSPTANESWP